MVGERIPSAVLFHRFSVPESRKVLMLALLLAGARSLRVDSSQAAGQRRAAPL